VMCMLGADCEIRLPNAVDRELFLTSRAPVLEPQCGAGGAPVVVVADGQPRLNCAVDLGGFTNATASWTTDAETTVGAAVSLIVAEGDNVVEVCVDSAPETCSGDVQVCACLETPVVGCAPPESRFAVSEPSPGTLEFDNQSPLLLPDCRPKVSWKIYAGGRLVEELETWTPGAITVEADGPYRVRLELSSVGGTSGSTAELGTSETACGCASSPIGLGWSWVVLLAFARRRDLRQTPLRNSASLR